MKYSGKENYEIELTEDRWEHIIYFHPEIGFEMNFIKKKLKDPDLIHAGNKYEILSIKKFEKPPVSNDKFCAVVYKKFPEEKSVFIITSYFSGRISKNRKILWEK